MNIFERKFYFFIYKIKRSNLDDLKIDINLKYNEICNELRNQGIVKLENCIPKSSIFKIKKFLDESLLKGENLSPNSSDINKTPYISVIQPQLHETEILEIALSDLIIGVSKCYLEAKPSLTGFNLRKSFVNDAPQWETQFYHSDRNSIKFLKFFIYLNDVDENGGPFVYIKTSHRKKFWGWLKKYRWNDDEIEMRYPKQKVLCTGKIGDMFIADTTGFHKGLKPSQNERGMLTINVSIHPDFMDAKQAFTLEKIKVQHISDNKKFFIDFLKIV